MANVISDETIEYVGILAKLELSEDEKEQAKKDMGSMLDYIDKLNELDTSGVEPMSHDFQYTMCSGKMWLSMEMPAKKCWPMHRRKKMAALLCRKR